MPTKYSCSTLESRPAKCLNWEDGLAGQVMQQGPYCKKHHVAPKFRLPVMVSCNLAAEGKGKASVNATQKERGRFKNNQLQNVSFLQFCLKFVFLDILGRELRRTWWPQCTYYVLPPLSDGNFILAFCFVMLMPTNFYPFLAIFLLKKCKLCNTQCNTQCVYIFWLSWEIHKPGFQVSYL